MGMKGERVKKDASVIRDIFYKDGYACKVLLYGKMQSGSYTNRDGKKIYTLQMRVEEIEFCGKKSESRMPYEEEFMNMPDYQDDELPFR